LGVSIYDARFLVVAQMLSARLVTEDAKLRRAAAGDAIVPGSETA